MIQKELKNILNLLSPNGSIISLDLETTGLDPKKDKIIEIGATKLNINSEEFESYSQLIDPGQIITEFITDLTGITNDDVTGMPVIDEVRDDFLDFLTNEIGEKHLIIAHNANFDINFLKNNGFSFDSNIFDTYDMAFVLLDRGEYNLEALANLFEINVKSFHRALDDSYATINIFLELLKIQINLGETNNKFSKIDLINTSQIKFAPHHISKTLINNDIKILEEKTGKSALQKKISSDLKIFPDNVDNFFSLNGIGQYIPNYEKRSNQIRMAKFVENNLTSPKISLVEAAPGTGKTIAYLAPIAIDILKNGTRAIISTNSIALQDQIINKDWRLIEKFLEDSGQIQKLSISVLKGRKNYVCSNIVNNFLPNGNKEARVHFKLLKWIQYSTEGDVGEIDLKTDFFIFSKFSSLNSSCLNTCRNCYVDIARKKAEKSNIVLINHSLAMTTSASERSLLKDADYIIIDEAHEIQRVATDNYSIKVNLESLKESIGYIKNIDWKFIFENEKLTELNQKELGIFIDDLKYLEEKIINLIKYFNEAEVVSKNYGKLVINSYKVDETEELISVLESSKKIILNQYIEYIYQYYEKSNLKNNSIDNRLNLIKSFENLLLNINTILEDADANMVSWVQSIRGDGFEFVSSPISVRNEMKETIFKDQDNVLLTGATLTSFGTPEEFCSEVGLDYLDDYEVIDTEFEYEKNVFLAVPQDMPEPNSEQYSKKLTELIINLSDKVKERILILFTSYSSLNKVRKELNLSMKEKNRTIISQGVDGSAARVINKFKKKGSILLATGPVWQGVDFGFDVEIKVLLIAKLPFAVPNDPLVNARSLKYIEPFNEYFVPEAVRKFKQGIGRLIRSNKDYGAIICADVRILTKSYGEEFMNSLPSYTYNQDLTQFQASKIGNWLNRHE